jgi:hypothetical protein
LDRAALAAQPDEIVVRLVRKALQVAGGGAKLFVLGPIEDLVGQIIGEQEFVKQTLSGAVIERTIDMVVFAREAARVAEEPQILLPGQEIIWDERFVLKNLSQSDKIEVVSGAYCTRAALEEILGGAVSTPMEHVGGAPLVRHVNGQVLAVGERIIDSAVSVRLVVRLDE